MEWARRVEQLEHWCEATSGESTLPENVKWSWPDDQCYNLAAAFSTAFDGRLQLDVFIVSIVSLAVLLLATLWIIGYCIYRRCNTPDYKGFMRHYYGYVLYLTFLCSLVWIGYVTGHCGITITDHCVPHLLAASTLVNFITLAFNILMLWIWGFYQTRRFQKNLILLQRGDIETYLKRLRDVSPTFTLRLTCYEGHGKHKHCTLDKIVTFEASCSENSFLVPANAKSWKDRVLALNMVFIAGNYESQQSLNVKKNELKDAY